MIRLKNIVKLTVLFLNYLKLGKTMKTLKMSSSLYLIKFAKMFLFSVVILLTACASSTKQSSQQISENLLIPCEIIKFKPSENFSDNIEFTVYLINLYGKCADNNDALIKAVKVYSNDK